MVSELHQAQYDRLVGMRRKVTVLINEMQREGGVSLASEVENLRAVANGLDMVLDEMDEADEGDA